MPIAAATPRRRARFGAETALPYLLSEPDDVPATVHQPWQLTVPTDVLRRALNANTSSAVGDHIDAIRITARDAGDRVATLELVGDQTRTLRGEQFRAILKPSPRRPRPAQHPSSCHPIGIRLRVRRRRFRGMASGCARSARWPVPAAASPSRRSWAPISTAPPSRAPERPSTLIRDRQRGSGTYPASRAGTCLQFA